MESRYLSCPAVTRDSLFIRFDKREREKEMEKERTDGRSRQLTLLRGRKAWDAKVDDPTSRGSRQGRAERSSVTNFARLCERRLVRVWGA